MAFCVGCVPYLNAKPLVRRFHDLGDASPVRVEYAVPSRLPEMLHSGLAQAVMVSSIEAIRHPGARVAGGVSISSLRDVQSVRLFCRVPPGEIRSVAFDQSSMTSNALVRIVLAEGYGVRPGGEAMPPDLETMLASHDAALLIGDHGMRGGPGDWHILDLGREWNALTGLPFVWAMWLGGDGLVTELAAQLVEAERYGRLHFEDVVRASVAETGFAYEQCEHYLGQIMDYRLTARHLAGLAEFGRRLVAHGILDECFLPSVVEGPSPADR